LAHGQEVRANCEAFLFVQSHAMQNFLKLNKLSLQQAKQNCAYPRRSSAVCGGLWSIGRHTADSLLCGRPSYSPQYSPCGARARSHKWVQRSKHTNWHETKTRRVIFSNDTHLKITPIDSYLRNEIAG
jgi:hypothetical protein